MNLKYLTSNALSLESIWIWAKQLVTDLNSMAMSAQTIPAGTIVNYAGSAAPEGWLLCDGGQYEANIQRSLFVAIGYTYGGSAGVFNVPDCRDRAMIGAGALVGLGEKAGEAAISLAEVNLPSHTHAVVDEGHTHEFTADAHNHTVTDPGHVHVVTDPGHTHAAGASAASLTGASGSNSDVTSQGSTDSAFTGITVNSSMTDVSIDDETVTGSNATSLTGVTVSATGEGASFSILNPVIGVTQIIKT